MNIWHNDQLPILQLGTDFYDPVQAAVFPQEKLRYWNNSLDVTIEKSHFARFNQIENNLTSPLALRYHGHQFQHYNPDLGDGRGFLFAQVKSKNQWYDLATKGSGQTPYSRSGDGRLTLKGAFREALATEMLESLGVKTSRTLCFFETGENLVRNDEPSPTRSAVLTRYSLGHIRIGTFQRLAYFKQAENIKKLVSYCMNFYYSEVPHGAENDEYLAGVFLQNVVERNALLVAQVMMAGFVHGVLNTDNINISGELFDYGPYRFMPSYDPEFTAAYFDQQGLYSYGRQPASFLWALHQLAGALQFAYPKLAVENILAGFSESFSSYIDDNFFRRLNLVKKSKEENSLLLSGFFNLLQTHQLNFENLFYDFHSKRILQEPQAVKKYEKLDAEILRRLDTFEIADPAKAMHTYFKAEKPETLLIDEIELLWKGISEHDDWSGFNTKLQSIRTFRGIY